VSTSTATGIRTRLPTCLSMRFGKFSEVTGGCPLASCELARRLATLNSTVLANRGLLDGIHFAFEPRQLGGILPVASEFGIEHLDSTRITTIRPTLIRYSTLIEILSLQL
jgi:hypothetical protein